MFLPAKNFNLSLMMTPKVPEFDANKLKQRALQTLDIESQAVAGLKERVNDAFIEVVKLILRAPGRLIITGIGKSAHIANKLVATLNSTGTPAGFMHAAEAIHGDLGLVQKGDVILCLSKSGNSPEIKVLVPLIKGLGHPLVAMTGALDSYLGLHADHVLDTTVEREACPHNPGANLQVTRSDYARGSGSEGREPVAHRGRRAARPRRRSAARASRRAPPSRPPPIRRRTALSCRRIRLAAPSGRRARP